MSSGGVTDLDTADGDYIDRLIRLIKGFPRRLQNAILAFDKHYDIDGEENHERTEFYTPNLYVWKLTNEFQDFLLPVVSVHPYRRDALEELEKWGQMVYLYFKFFLILSCASWSLTKNLLS
jgi:uncharacterized protein